MALLVPSVASGTAVWYLPAIYGVSARPSAPFEPPRVVAGAHTPVHSFTGIITNVGYVTMSDALLKSIDKRLQDVATDMVAVKLQVNTIDGKLDALGDKVGLLPTWAKLWTTITASIVSVGALIAWLTNGGAKWVFHVFGPP